MTLLLIGIILVGGVTSQSLMDASMILLSLIVIKKFFTREYHLKDIKPLGIEWAIAGYFCVAVVGLYLNGKAPVPWGFYLSKFTWVLNLYILILAFKKTDFKFNKYLIFFSAAFFLPNMYALASYFLNYDYVNKIEVREIIGLVNSSTYHSHANSLIFIVFLSFYVFGFEKLKKSEKLIHLLSLIIMGGSVFLTYTRGIWAATFISVFILLWLKNKKIALGFVLICAIAGFSLYMNYEPIRLRVLNSFSSHSDQVRSNLIQVHWLMFKEHPWVGIGFWDSYRQIADYWPKMGLKPTYFESHAHNQLVNVLGTTGILGITFFIAMCLFFFRKAWLFYKNSKAKNIHPLAVALLMLLVQFSLACLTDVTFEYAKIRGILVVGLAAIISFSSEDRLKNET